MIAAAAALMAIGRSAQAQIVYYYAESTSHGNFDPTGPTLQIESDVTGSYLYTYTFTVGTGGTWGSISSTPEASFTAVNENPIGYIDITVVDPSDITSISSGGVLSGDDITWNFGTKATPITVSFNSPLPPGLFDVTADDSSVDWSGSVLTPVPEASTVMAGALMLLPLGIGAIRAVRKERVA